MKKSIIYLGLVALVFTNNIAAKELEEQNFDKRQETLSENLTISANQKNSKKLEIASSNETDFFDPNSVIKSSHKKTVEEIIVENNIITETTDEIYKPISLEKTVEDSIGEYNQIIESTHINEEFPLDFEKINRAIQCFKVSNNNATIIIDLKL